LQNVHHTLYQNDFSSINYGQPIKTKGDSFASNGALIDPTIFIPFANLLMVFNYESNWFPLRNNKLKLGKTIYTFSLTHYMTFLETNCDLRTPVATPLQPPRTFCLVTIIGNFPKITLVGPTLRHLYPHR
jgi:hypothetical protein